MKPQMRTGPWLTAEEARVYTRRPSMHAWYTFRWRYRLVSSRAGLFAQADLDRVLNEPRRVAKAALHTSAKETETDAENR